MPLLAFEQACKDRGINPTWQLRDLGKRNLKYPDAWKRYSRPRESSYGQSKPFNGQVEVWQRFTAKNAFGMESHYTASIMVNEADCSLDLSTFETFEGR